MTRTRLDTPDKQREWLESKLERMACKQVHEKGGAAYKFAAPAYGAAYASLPDRLICLPDVRPFFVEFKRWNAKPTDNQVREFKRLYLLGNDVYFIDNLIDFATVIITQLTGNRILPWHVSPPGEIYDKLWIELQEYQT